MSKQIVFVVVLIFFSLVIGATIILIILQNKPGVMPTEKSSTQVPVVSSPTIYPSDNPSMQPSKVPITAQISKEETVRQVVENFENALQSKNVTEVVGMFTPPLLESEKQSYDSMMGLDGAAGPRLFNTGGSNFKIDSWSTESVQFSTSGDFEIRVVVNEQRRNWSQMTGYSEPVTTKMFLEMTERSGEIKITNYYFYYGDAGGAGAGSVKYNGLGF